MSPTSSSSETLNHRTRLGETALTLDLALNAATCPAISAKFGPDSAVFLHLVTRRRPDIPVIRVETGYDSRETLQFVESLRTRLDLNLHVFRPEHHVIRIPPGLDDPAHAAFAEEVKLAPFRHALERLGVDVWLSSVRRYQSAHRGALEPFEQLGNGLLKVSPMLGWTRRDVERYAREHGLPIGPVAFDPTKGEPFRECGLHGRLGA